VLKIALQHEVQNAPCSWGLVATRRVRGVPLLRAVHYFSSMNVMENLHSTGTADDTVDIRKTSHGTLD
jgi:hypothetical protein